MGGNPWRFCVKGFTLIELLVVVLIIGILTAAAMPAYQKAVERSRMVEAVNLLDAIAQAQERRYMNINKYALDFRGLGVAPRGASGPAFCTKGVVSAGTPACGTGNGFLMRLTGTSVADGVGYADRVSPGEIRYAYTLSRKYDSTGTTCSGSNDNGKALCADYCGIDTPADSCCSDGRSSACDAVSAP